MAQTAILIVFAVVTGLFARSVATEYSTPIVFLAYRWADTIAWLGPVLFLSAAAAVSFGSLALRSATGADRRGTPATVRRCRWLAMKALTLVFLAMLVELLTFVALNGDLGASRHYRFLVTTNAIAPTLLLVAAIIGALVDAYRIASHVGQERPAMMAAGGDAHSS